MCVWGGGGGGGGGEMDTPEVCMYVSVSVYLYMVSLDHRHIPERLQRGEFGRKETPYQFRRGIGI